MEMTDKLDFLLKVAKEAAVSSGKILKEGFRTSFKINNKPGIHNLVTEYDFKSEKNIIGLIKNNFPSHCILSEECGIKKSEDEDVCWIIDPLDGTVNFAHGIPVFGINVAVKEKDEIILGVTYQPLTDELFIGIKGLGATLNGQPIKVSATKKLKDAIVGTGFPYNLHENPNRCIERFFSIAKLGIPIRRLGAACIDFAYLASGRYDAFWETNLGPWDCAAGKVILEEAGGKITNWQGKPFLLQEKNQVIATNGLIHSEIEKVFKQYDH